MFNTIKRIHLVGVGGSGMSGIALVLNGAGYFVSGSDLKKSDVTEHLQISGIKVYFGHKASNIKGADVVVYSSAIDYKNPEIKAALKKKLPVIRRAEMLAEIARIKYAVTVAGTHGKTTTTSLLGGVLEEAKMDPTIIVGGKLKSLGSGAKSGKGDYLVAEADESDGSFLKLSPAITIVTNIDNDHMDYYKTFDNLRESFVKHINSVPFYGYSVLCADDPVIRKSLKDINRKYYTYALNHKADFTAGKIKVAGGKTVFNVYRNSKCLGHVSLSLFGKHNILNALAVCACADRLGINIKTISKALGNFSGVGRRLELIGQKNDILFYDDYAHHPSEIYSSLKALRERFPGRRIVCIFQPHRYSRTSLLYREIARSLVNTDKLYLAPLYPAGENAIKGVSSELIAGALKKIGKNSEIVDFKASYDKIFNSLLENDIFVTMGAGDICKLHSLFNIKWQ